MCREGGSGQRPPSEGPSQQLFLHETTCLVPSLPGQEPALGWRGEPKAFLGKLEGMDQCRAPNPNRKGKEGEILRKVVNSDMVLPSLHAFHTLNICSCLRDPGVGWCVWDTSVWDMPLTSLLAFLAAHSSFPCCCVCFLHCSLCSLPQGEVGEPGLPGARGLPGASGPKVTLDLESEGADQGHSLS